VNLGIEQPGLFVAAVFVLNATPGVDMLLTVTRTLQGGTRAGLAAACGIVAGCAVHVLAAAFGLAALLAVFFWAFTLIQWAGAAYLLWLALGMLRSAWRPTGPPVVADTRPLTLSWRADFRRGLLTNLLNPKVALFVLAFVPQFIGAGSAHKTLAFLALGALLVVQGLLFLVALVALVAPLRRVRGSPRLARGLNAVGAAMFAALALRLLASAQRAAA
jgi:threonine/homoserine/homoserine lactone efflux protein